ncbi:hypothetical protein SLE2022_053160 [Rubroshorea leprosula]
MNCQQQTMLATERSLALYSEVFYSAGDCCNAYGAISNMLLMCGPRRYPSTFPAMARPLFPPCPPGPLGVIPAPLPHVGIPGVRPILPSLVRPGVLPIVTPAEKPQTTVYIGMIAPTVDNDFMLSLLHLCGPVKSWKRAQDPTDGTLRAFGFCEFESAEGVLRVVNLISMGKNCQ